MTNQDWPTTVARFEELFGRKRTTRQPSGLTGSNFMTPEYLGVVTNHLKEPVEVSTGMGFREDRIFGVTYGRVDGKPDERDQMCSSLEECYEVIFGVPLPLPDAPRTSGRSS